MTKFGRFSTYDSYTGSWISATLNSCKIVNKVSPLFTPHNSWIIDYGRRGRLPTGHDILHVSTNSGLPRQSWEKRKDLRVNEKGFF